MNALVEYFVSRSIFVNILTVLLIVMGAFTALTMNREAFPNINFDIVSVNTIYPGASAEEIELQITKPLEDSIKEVDGIKEYRSASIENRSGIAITIDPDVDDSQKVVDDIRAAVDRTEDLPEDSEKPIITEITTARQPVIELNLARTKKDGKFILDEKQLRDLARILEERLRDMKGVARINRRGWREREIQVNVNPRLMERYYLSAEMVIAAIQNRNINLPGGKIEHKGRESIVRTVGKFKNKKDVENVVVRSNDIGQAVRIKQIASVKDYFEDSLYIDKADGLPSITLIVVKRQSADAIKVVDKTRALVKDFLKDSGEGVQISEANDLSFFVRRRLKVLISNATTGLALVILSLFVFLGWRTALMATLGIPIALGMTFVAMLQIGMTMNLIAMFGIILVIGIVVDDAIIVCENVYRYIEEGHSPFDATVKGTREVIAPVMATITTTIAAFGPMLFMTGIFGKFIWSIPMVVILALISSFLESFFILPSHLYDINKWSRPKAKEPGKESGPFVRFREKIYIPALSWSLNHRLIIIPIFIVVLVGSVMAQGIFGRFVLFPAAIDAFQIRVTAPREYTKEETEKFTRAVEWELSKHTREDLSKNPKVQPSQQDLKNYITRVGIHQQDANDPFTRRGSQYAQVTVYLTPEQDRDRKTAEIINGLRSRLKWMLNEEALKKLEEREQKERDKRKEKGQAPAATANIASVSIQNTDPAISAEKYPELKGRLANLEFLKVQGGPPTGRPVAIQITGDNFDTLREIGDKYMKLMEGIEGVVDINNSLVDGKDEIRFKVKERLAAQTGVSERQVATALTIAFQGVEATTIKQADEEISVRVRFDEKYRTPGGWRNIAMMNSFGNLIPLSTLVNREQGKSISAINHYQGRRQLSVSADVEPPMTSQEANTLIEKLAKDIPGQYKGYNIKYGGEFEDTQESMASLGRAFIVGITIIFMILCSLFRSFFQPLVVLAAIPFAIIGVIIAFLAHGEPLSFLGFMGVIGLSGVVVNDSIVLVDFANHIRDDNPDMSINEIVIKAASLRLRAVTLTTLTTVLGLLPTAYGIGGYDPFLVPMALSFAWGLLFATFLTLLLVPLLYKGAHNIRILLKGGSGRTEEIVHDEDIMPIKEPDEIEADLYGDRGASTSGQYGINGGIKVDGE